MDSYEESFIPESIDEQVDRCLLQRGQSISPDICLVRDLSEVYQEYESVHMRVRQRLGAHLDHAIGTQSSQVVNRKPFSSRPARSKHLKQDIASRRGDIYHRLGLMAAVVTAIFLVGTLSWVFTLAHHAQHPVSDLVSAQQMQLPETVPAGVYSAGSGNVERMDAQTGKIVWKIHLAGLPYSSSSLSGPSVSIVKIVPAYDTLYVAVDCFARCQEYRVHSSLFALNAENGTLRWVHSFNGTLNSMNLAVADRVVYVAVNVASPGVDGLVYAFDTAGKIRGTAYHFPAPVQGLTVVNGTLYTTSSSALYATDLASGQVIWHKSITGATPHTVMTNPYLIHSLLYAGIANVNEGGSTVSYVAAFQTANGNLSWQSAPVPGQLFDITATHNTIYFGTLDSSPDGTFRGTLYAYSAQEGKHLWQHNVAGGIQWRPTVVDGVVYVSVYPSASAPSTLLALRATDGNQQWAAQVGTGVAIGPEVVAGTVYIVTANYSSHLEAFSIANHASIWETSPDYPMEALAVVA